MILPGDGLDALVALLIGEGRAVYGPVARDGAVVLDRIESPGALARGWTIEAGPGRYRAHPGGDAVFDHVIGPTPWKRFLHPPRETLYRMTRTAEGIAVTAPADEATPTPMAFLGVRPCDLAALAALDRAMTGGPHADPRYARRRAATLLIAVNCRVAAETCFCASMGTGPAAEAGYDLVLSELGRGDGTRFLIAAGSPQGAAVMAALPDLRPATDEDAAEARAGSGSAAAAQVRRVKPEGLPPRLRAASEHPHWDAVAARCLNCTNCTMVCPTCFCTSVEEVSDLAGTGFERRQRWDSCFTTDFSHVHGGSVRPSARSRYRQWLTHKLGTWPEQFGGDLGCTGCGRCIAWCPVGIDLTEELAILTEPAP